MARTLTHNRLVAPAEKGRETPSRQGPPHLCLECAYPLEGAHKRFCNNRCRSRFNNRRQTRGAQLYDLYMAHRFDRTVAKDLNVLTMLNRLASDFRQLDSRERNGRASWRPPADVLANKPGLKAVAFLAHPVAKKR